MSHDVSVDCDGVSLRVHSAGEGEPVLMLHGFPDTAEVWRHQIPALVDAGFHVIAPDLRGFGESDKPDDVWAYGLQIVLQDVISVLDAFNIGAARIVAHDLGCGPGWGLATWFPDRVDRFVAMSVGHGASLIGSDVEQRRRSWYILLFNLPLAEDTLRRDDWALFREWTTYRDSRDLDDTIARLSAPGALTAALNWYRAIVPPEVLFGPNPFADVDHVTCPTMGIHGEHDPYVTEAQMQGSSRYIAGTWRYELVEDAGHWMQLDRPDRINQLLLEFLA